MYTEFGKWLKTFRISIGIRLYEFSNALGVSPSFVSAIETGKKSIPLDFVEKIKSNYSLTPDQEQSLNETITKTREEELKRKNSCQIRVKTTDNEVQELIYAFARRADDFNSEEKKALWKILNKNGGEGSV